MKNSKFNIRFRRGVAASLGAICCSSIISEAKIDIDLKNIMNDFKLSETDPNKFKDIIKQKTDDLLKLGTIEIDPSFERVDDKSKFVVISALEKLSEIPLVKKALTHNGQKCKLVISNHDFLKPAAYMYDKKPYSNTMFVCSNFFEESMKKFSISDGNLKLGEHIEKINTGDKFQDKNSFIDKCVCTRLLYGVNQPMEIKKVIFALNIITHEVGHAVGFYTAEIFSKDKDSWDKFLKLVEITGIQPKSKEKNVEKTYDKIKEQLKSCIEGKMNIRIPQNFIKTWLIGSDPALFISRRATDNKDEYLAELFVHLCGLNLPISQHSKRYADILKVIHGEDCLGPTVKYQ